MKSGVNQILKLSAAESTYGETIGSPTWTALGKIVSSGENASEVDIIKEYGIGSAEAQALIPSEVSNSLRAELVAPTASAINMAITRTSGLLASYNFLAGDLSNADRGTGLKWNSLSIDIPEKGSLKCTLDGIYKQWLATQVANTAQAPADTPIWRRDGLVLSIAGSPDVDLVSAQITLGNNLSKHGQDNTTANQKRTFKELLEGGKDVSATIQTLTEPTFNLQADTLGCTPITLVATFTDLCGGGTPGTLVITCTGGIYKRKTKPISPNTAINYAVVIEFTDISVE